MTKQEYLGLYAEGWTKGDLNKILEALPLDTNLVIQTKASSRKTHSQPTLTNLKHKPKVVSQVFFGPQ